jgi:hypothetical protein
VTANRGAEPATRLAGGPYDTDRLLAGYRAAWAQEPMFDVRRSTSGSAAYDEFVDAAGNVRPGRRELAEIVGERGRAGLDRLRANLRALPGASGSSRAERLVDEIGTRLRRIDPARPDRVTAGGQRAELAGLLSGTHDGLLELADVITSTQLSLPREMQPLWGPDLRRVVP